MHYYLLHIFFTEKKKKGRKVKGSFFPEFDHYIPISNVREMKIEGNRKDKDILSIYSGVIRRKIYGSVGPSGSSKLVISRRTVCTPSHAAPPAD